MTSVALRLARLEQRWPERPHRLLTPLELAAAVGFTPDPWQADVLTSTAPRIALNVTRQGGKSLTAALLALWTALYDPPALVLMLSPALRQSQELFRKVLDSYRQLDGAPPPDAESALRLEVRGSRIISLPGREVSIRGYSKVKLLIVDEAARVSDTLYASVRPMLAISHGRLLTLSTPWGTRGWWYEAWRGAEAWQRVEVPATACPRISPQFLAEEQRTLGQFWYEQEYLCQFLDAESQAFRREDIDRAFTEEVAAWAV